MPALRVKFPCNDEREFYARFADRIAAHGLRIPTERQRPVGTRVQIALEFRDGSALRGDAIVDAHVQLDSRSGLNVRFVRLERDESTGAAPGSPDREAPSSRTAPAATSDRGFAPDMPLGDELLEFGASTDAPPPGLGSVTTSAEIGAVLDRGRARIRHAAIALLGAALLLAVAGWFVAREAGRQVTPERVFAAHIEAADRLLAEGRVTGDGSALEQLLAARNLHPNDPRSNERLARLADMFESLGARALERGDLSVAVIHLQDARAAAPDRASIRAKLDALEKRRREDAARERKGPGGRRR